jgi:hypothetical protein
MVDCPTHRAFFADTERNFALSFELAGELERKTGVGIGALFNRLFRADFSLADVTETIRLGLIGGGSTPAQAASIVRTYVENRPLSETYPLAVAILETVWFGKANEPKTEDDHGSN